MALQQCDTMANHSATSCSEKHLRSHHNNFASLGVAECKTAKLKVQKASFPLQSPAIMFKAPKYTVELFADAPVAIMDGSFLTSLIYSIFYSIFILMMLLAYDSTFKLYCPSHWKHKRHNDLNGNI